jgi:uracil-DNA glycosylase
MENMCDESCRLDRLAREISVCPLCDLSLTRTRAVPGEGPSKVGIMFIGEAPGAEEDLTGRPFVGRAGKLLDKALAEAGISRSEVFITSVVKCRPPANRQPRSFEIRACAPYLTAQMNLLGPKMICLLGNVAAKAVIGKTGVNELHGLVLNDKFMVTFHPAAVLRNKDLREPMVSDLKKLASLVRPGQDSTQE